jgi:Bacterial PH domain
MKHSTMTTFEIERALDLAAPLPEGEHVIWLDSPDWKSFALRVFHLKALAIYFGILIAANVAWMASNNVSSAEMLASSARVFALSAAALAMFGLLAWLMAKSTTYAITNHRVFLRIGVALSITVTVPFKTIRSADLRTFADGTGDLPLSLTGHDRLAYLHLWPHARPWQLKDTAPMLRAVPNAKQVAEILATALLGNVNAVNATNAKSLHQTSEHVVGSASGAHVQTIAPNARATA